MLVLNPSTTPNVTSGYHVGMHNQYIPNVGACRPYVADPIARRVRFSAVFCGRVVPLGPLGFHRAM